MLFLRIVALRSSLSGRLPDVVSLVSALFSGRVHFALGDSLHDEAGMPHFANALRRAVDVKLFERLTNGDGTVFRAIFKNFSSLCLFCHDVTPSFFVLPRRSGAECFALSTIEA